MDKVSSTQIGFTQVGSLQGAFGQFCSSQVSPAEISVVQLGRIQDSSTQISSTQVSSFQISAEKVSSTQIGVTQINFGKVSTDKLNSTQINPTKIPLSSSITLEQLFSIHNSFPLSNNIYKDNALNFWSTTFNLTLQITDLPTGQLAEAQITNYDTQGRPNSGTILIDHNANGLGWFIDPTPWENSEFTTTLTDTAFRATTGDAFGKYDLLTTILHETVHLAGFIAGYNEFDRHISTINGSKVFIGDNFTATLTNDGSHLDAKLHPLDLMNTSLAPGVRKLPSLLNLQILNAVRKNTATIANIATLTAPLTSTPLIAILNGSFDEDDPTALDYGWSTRGAATILNSQAVLTEDSPFNSNFTQTFTVPTGAKYLQFTILDTQLGTNTFAPNDAFEVALLDAQTLTPLIGTATGLTQTDSLLNLQQTGNAYFSPTVTVPGASTSGDKIALNTPRTVNIDISNIAPGTLATLYFDLLGFGAKDSTVIIDDVRLVDEDTIAPVTQDDTATTNQGRPVIIDILNNDSDTDGTIDISTIQINTAPQSGNIKINDDSTVTYTPNINFVGTDSFTYIVQDNDSNTSNLATVNVVVNKVQLQILDIPQYKKTYQQDPTQFTANVIEPEDAQVTYTWDFGDGTDPVIGNIVYHTFAESGEYQTTLTVMDAYGLKDEKTVTVYVTVDPPEITDDEVLPDFNGDFRDIFADFNDLTADFPDIFSNLS